MRNSRIRDVLAKSLGSSNHANVVKATLEALRQLRLKEQIFKIRGIPFRTKQSAMALAAEIAAADVAAV